VGHSAVSRAVGDEAGERSGVRWSEELSWFIGAVEFVRWKVRQRNQEAGVETRSLLQRVVG